MSETTGQESFDIPGTGTYIAGQDLLDLGKRSANGIIKQLIAIAETLDTFRAEGSKFRTHPFSMLHDAAFDLFAEVHDLPEPYDSSEAVAAFGAAVFGQDAVPDVWDYERASRVKLAFRVARLILTCDDRGRMDAFFIACAIAAKRKTDKERLKKVKKSARKRIRKSGG